MGHMFGYTMLIKLLTIKLRSFAISHWDAPNVAPYLNVMRGKHMNLPPDIELRIERDFVDMAERSAVKELFVGLEVQEKERVVRCILFVAKGNLDMLRKMEVLARTDYRDVIMAGEYEYPTDRRLRNLNEPFSA